MVLCILKVTSPAMIYMQSFYTKHQDFHIEKIVLMSREII